MPTTIACGSWADPVYGGLLYPRGFPPELRLSGYAMWFDSIEVNSTYYAIPKKEIVARWVSHTPSTFRFDIRLHQAFSRSPEKAAQNGRLLELFFEGLRPLLDAERFGAFLLVLPPSFTPERHRLEELDLLIQKIQPHPLAIELRHAGWVTGKIRAATLDFFHQRKVTWVAVDMPRVATLMPPVDEVTQPRLAYLRLHGRNANYLNAKSAAERHTYAYNESELKQIVKRIRHLSALAKDVRVVANNHARDFAPRTALALRQMLGQI